MVIALAQPAIGTIFADKYVQAPLFLALLSIGYLYSAFGNLSMGNMINGQGYTTFNLKLTILTAAIGFPLGFVLIYKFGVIGLIITTLTDNLPSLFIGLRFIKEALRSIRRLGFFRQDFASSAIAPYLNIWLLFPICRFPM